MKDTFSNIPIGFIPLGSHNSLSPSLHLLSDNKVKYVTLHCTVLASVPCAAATQKSCQCGVNKVQP